MAQTHKCGRCDKSFKTEDAYLNHECAATGYKPTEPEHHGPEFAAISEAALARGAQRQAKARRGK